MSGAKVPPNRLRSLAILVIVVVLLTVTAILIWQFVPTKSKDIIGQIIPGGSSNTTSYSANFSSYTKAPAPSYQFFQCSSTASQCCNGLETICDLAVNEVFFASAHNAMASRENGFIISPNHQYKFEGALLAGYRVMDIDICNCGGELQLCHGVCNYGIRDPRESFAHILQFVQENPTEIVLITMEVNNEAGDYVNLFDVDAMLQTISGFKESLYLHTRGDPWPTLGQLVANDTRLILFQFNTNITTSNWTDGVTTPVGFHYWFDFAFETQYNFRKLAAIENTTASCVVTRGLSSSTREFFAVNAYVTLPDYDDQNVINSFNFSRNHVNACSKFNSDFFVQQLKVDFWNLGNIPQLVQTRNKALGRRRQRQMKNLLLREQ